MITYSRTHIKAAIAFAVLLTVIFATLSAREGAKVTQVPISLSIEATPSAMQKFPENEGIDSDVHDVPWVAVKIKSGDSLSTIFKKMGLKAYELQKIVDIGVDASILRKIAVGNSLSLQISPSGELLGLRYDKNALESLRIKRTEDGFAAFHDKSVPEFIVAYETAAISTDSPSLYHAGKKAGLSDNIIMKLSYIFQWDISFALDLRKGDSFALLYEEIFVDGEKVKEGDILAAQFQNMGKTYSAVLYEDNNGLKNYYTPEGRSMRKAFIRDPVHFSHVSSNFNPRRFHPIRKRVMPHRGIDYAASKGTPVVAAGDGTVTIARQNRTSGKYVVIQHGEQYTTKYLHLSNFSKGVKSRRTVKQGQTIGYVGATGLATASHLHFEFLVNGVHRNPRTVKLPKAKSIAASNLAHFKSSTNSILMRLASIAGTSSLANISSKANRDG